MCFVKMVHVPMRLVGPNSGTFLCSIFAGQHALVSNKSYRILFDRLLWFGSLHSFETKCSDRAAAL